jgi:hypothetical protein
MDMSSDTTNIAARRLEMANTKPVNKSQQAHVGELLAAHSVAEVNGNVNRRKPQKDSRYKKMEQIAGSAHEWDESAQDELNISEEPRTGRDDGEHHVLDVKV